MARKLTGMNTLLKLAGAVTLACAAWMACEIAWMARETRSVVAGLPVLVSDEMELTRQAAVEQIRDLSKVARKEIVDTRKDANAQLSGLRRDLQAQSKLWREMVDGQAGRANDSLAGLRSDALPVLQNAAQVEANVNRTIDVLRPQALGALAASKVTAGNAAQITRDLKPAAPAATKAIQNVERVTRPLAWPLRILGGIWTVFKKIL